MTNRAAGWRALGVAMIGVAVLGVPGASPGAAPTQAACDPPYLPVWGEAQQQGPGSDPTQVWPAEPAVRPSTEGTDLSYPDAQRAAGVDMDGDGTADQIAVEGTELVVARGDGVLRLGTAGAGVSVSNLYPVGDLDADGHDELWFIASPAGPGGDISYVVPGITPTGTHESADVAIHVPDGIRYPVGQQVDGSGADLLVLAAGDVFVASGDDVMAPGPGGTLGGFDPASEVFAGADVAVLDLGGAAPTIATVVDLGDATDFVLWDQGTTTRYTTAGAGPSARLDPNGSPFLQAIDTADGLVLVGGSSNRGGSTRFIWNLEDPCAGPILAETPVTTSTTPTNPAGPTGASPATAVPGTADYTG